MDLIVDFVTENFVWVIVVGIVILMAIVGYVADKTNFGRNKVEKVEKPKKEKIKKEKKKKETEQTSVIEEKKETEVSVMEENSNVDLVNDYSSLSQLVENNHETFDNQESNDYQTFGESDYEQTMKQEIEPNFSTESNMFMNSQNNSINEVVDQSLFEPLPSIEQANYEQPVENNIEVNSEPININFDEQPQANSDIDSDDDIWKF